VTTASLDQAVPLRLGSAADFSRARSLLSTAQYDEDTICRTLGVESLAELGRVGPEDLDARAAGSSLLSLLVRVFLFGQPISPLELDGAIEPAARGSLLALDLLRVGRLGTDRERSGDVYYAPVLLYPVAGVVIASDRYDNPDGSPFVAPPDVVFPAIFAGTLRFLRIISRSPAGDALDLCSGTGIGALALSRHVDRLVASDLTARATHFTRFNGLLNGCANVEVVQGDLYQAVEGRTFDRIIAHPPYVPALAAVQIYRDAGETGESVLRPIVEGLPRYLRPGGTFYGVSAAWDSREGPFEERLRGWLGERASEFDVIFAPHEELSREQVARWLTEKSRAAAPAGGARWEQQFTEAGLERHVYGAIVLHRFLPEAAGGRGHPVTVRPRLSALTDGTCIDWALRWYPWRAAREAAGDLSRALLGTAPRLAPDLRVKATYVPRDGALAPGQIVLETDRPFRAATKIDPWMLSLVAGFGGGRTARQVYDAAHAAGALPEGFGPEPFATLVAMLVERGYVEVEEAVLDGASR
jgi:methylase of polypeptide subunit release factors